MYITKEKLIEDLEKSFIRGNKPKITKSPFTFIVKNIYLLAIILIIGLPVLASVVYLVTAIFIVSILIILLAIPAIILDTMFNAIFKDKKDTKNE